MPDLRNATVPESNKFTVSFETVGGPFTPGPPFPTMYINKRSFVSKDTYFASLRLGEIYEWTVQIAGDSNVEAGNHPFHMHVNPVQVVSVGEGLNEILGVKLGESIGILFRCGKVDRSKSGSSLIRLQDEL